MKKSTILLYVSFLTTMGFNIHAQDISYHFKVHTKDVIRGGTDNTVYLRLTGSNGKTPWIKIQGDKERNDIDEFNYDAKDIGRIEKLWVDVSGDLADKWDLDYVKVTKDSDKHKKNYEKGYYEFKPNKEMSYDKESFKPTYKKHARLSVTKKGNPVYESKNTTIVNFGSNLKGSEPQLIMKFKETWTNIETVSITESNSVNTGSMVKLSYKNPGDPKLVGQYGVEFTASINETVSTQKNESSQSIKTSTYDWAYTAAAGKDVFRKASFEIPYEYQEYKVGNKKMYMRNLDAKIVPKSEEFLDIPYIVNGEVVPIKWSEIKNNWLIHIQDNFMKRIIKGKKEEWKNLGYIID